MVELSRQFVNVQPIYIISEDRNSQKREMPATKKICEALMNDSITKAKIFDIKLINKNNIPEEAIKRNQNMVNINHCKYYIRHIIKW